jgi:alpha-methylacyl-CoA racemase
MQRPLDGTLVVDFTRYLPGAFASAELRRLGARVVRAERPGGEPMRSSAPEWWATLDAGKESVVCDPPDELSRALLARADVVLESFRPGVAAKLGIGPDDTPASAVYCSITGFGAEGPHAQRAGHDLNYLGYAGVLEATAPSLPPVQVADLAAGGMSAVTEILAALLAGGGARIVVSMTHGAHRLVSRAPVLTQGAACYRMYETADGRHLTVAALEPKFFSRLCELLGRPDLADRQFLPDDGTLAGIFRTRTLAEWLELVEGEDVCVGPVATVAEAEATVGAPAERAPGLGEHTAAWRADLGL